MNDAELKELLDFDPLADAEQKTGASYKDSKFTTWLGFETAIEHNTDKSRALAAAGDSGFDTTVVEYLFICADLGFVPVYQEPFCDPQTGRKEALFVLWNPTGILLCFDTFNTDRVNGGSFYYNWKKHSDHPHGILSNCRWRADVDGKMVVIGSHDCREAIRFHIRQLETYGSFLPQWIERPFLWLVHHGDKQGNKRLDNYKTLNEQRIAKLPRYVRMAITPA